MIEATLCLPRGAFTLDVALQLPTDGVSALFGPSGCGKTTLLRCLAGLEHAPGGRVVVDGQAWQHGATFVPVHRRAVGVVFQEASLFEHLDVRANVAFGWKRLAPAERRIPLDDAIAWTGIEPLLQRATTGLSGGERQRVAIARALAVSPRLLLMDEPLASLDSVRRSEILPFLIRVREKLRLPMIYVTHSADELIRLADQVVLLEAGRVLAAGPIADIAARVDLPLAARNDAAGVLSGYLHSHDPERRLSAVACGGQIYLVPRQDLEPRTPVRLRIPAREVILGLDAPRGISVNNVVPAVVCAVGADEAAHAALVEIDVGGGTILSRITLDAAQRLELRPGTRVLAFIKSVSIEVVAG